MSPRNSSDAMLRVPDVLDRMLRVPDVLDRIGVSRRTLCRWRADSTFPQALQLGANSIRLAPTGHRRVARQPAPRRRVTHAKPSHTTTPERVTGR